MSTMSEAAILLKRLKELENGIDHESDHFEADWALLRYINIPEITKAFQAIPKWYA